MKAPWAGPDPALPHVVRMALISPLNWGDLWSRSHCQTELETMSEVTSFNVKARAKHSAGPTGAGSVFVEGIAQGCPIRAV